jgi:hypothetical protein
MKGINFADLEKEPYIYPKNNDPDNYRPILKVLLLAAINSKTDVECVKAVRFEINMNRNEFPDDIPDLNEVYKTFKTYHSDIADLFGSKLGLKLQRWDSSIAEDVVRVMTEHEIPVLVIHDSFIVPKGEEQFLEETMKIVFNKHASELGLLSGLKVKISDNPVLMKTKDITEKQTELFTEEDIISDLAGRLDSPQARRFILYKENQDPSTNVTIKVHNGSIEEAGYDLTEYVFKEEDFMDEEFTE